MEPKYECQHCGRRSRDDAEYCPDCGYAAVEESSPTCDLCLTEMEFVEAAGPWSDDLYKYRCQSCARDWLVPLDVAD
ncbi:hypothetical protein BDK61_1467 [Haloarcula quadrata]|uniref:Uncharacterized protein n=1 Tax=Haloarcula quadrata TaxID=182779 RepID=A0A495R5L2_9EURY|nr:zinc-ribbon domain-containing protein [Haloarcula quadrata]RKS82168.1 hypothetical protein BDK61_1467 [Haloarcula quadrata]